MMFSMKDFFSKCEQIRRNLRICSHLLKKSLIENFIYCAVSSKKVFLEVSQYSLENICVGVFFNKVAGFGLKLYLKETSTQMFSCEYCEIFTSRFFFRTQFGGTVMGICRSSLLNQKHNAGRFLLRRFVDLVRVCYLHIISRNHSNEL